MRRRITMLVMAALLALTMALGGAGAAFAKVGFTTDFERVQTTETCVKGSHGPTATHQRAPDGSVKDRGGGDCKVTGSTHTC
jgi:hypothetical protein